MWLTRPSQRRRLSDCKANMERYFCLGQDKDISTSQDISVGNAILPGDPQNPPEVAQVEGVESALLGLAAIEEHATHTGLVHPPVGVGGQHGVVPDFLCQARYCCCRFADSHVYFGIKAEVAGDGGAKIRELFHQLEGVLTD